MPRRIAILKTLTAIEKKPHLCTSMDNHRNRILTIIVTISVLINNCINCQLFGQETLTESLEGYLPNPNEIMRDNISLILIHYSDNKPSDTIKYDTNTGLIKCIVYVYDCQNLYLPKETINFFYKNNIRESIIRTIYEYSAWPHKSDCKKISERVEAFIYDSIGRLILYDGCLQLDQTRSNYSYNGGLKYIYITKDSIKLQITKDSKNPDYSDTTFYFYDDLNRLIKKTYNNWNITFFYKRDKTIERSIFSFDRMATREKTKVYKKGKLIHSTFSSNRLKARTNYFYKNGIIKKWVSKANRGEKHKRVVHFIVKSD